MFIIGMGEERVTALFLCFIEPCAKVVALAHEMFIYYPFTPRAPIDILFLKRLHIFNRLITRISMSVLLFYWDK
ncbi:hypothetical protein TCA2_3996 [Paenibacillus sp. TCA20]|nr:hypothetical protein TCA2_3996 [Paenibacillus sp. TCA20]